MKRFPRSLRIALVVALGLVGVTAWAQVGVALVDFSPRAMVHGFWAGTQGVTAAGNKVTNMLAGSAVVDVTSTSTLTCTDMAFATATGAKAGDPCIVGLPATHPTNGSGSFSCVVTAADTVKLRFCNPSAGSLDPSSATFFFRVISSQ